MTKTGLFSYWIVLLWTSSLIKLITSQYHYTRHQPYLPGPGTSSANFPIPSYTKPKYLEGSPAEYETYDPTNNSGYLQINPNFNKNFHYSSPPQSSSENFGGFYPSTTYPYRNGRLNQISMQNNGHFQPQQLLQPGKIFNQIQNNPSQPHHPTKLINSNQMSIPPENQQVAFNLNKTPISETTFSNYSSVKNSENFVQPKAPAESQHNQVTQYPPPNNWNQQLEQSNNFNQFQQSNHQQLPNEMVMLQNLTTLKFVPSQQLKNCVPIPGAHGACVILQHEDEPPVTTNPPLPVALPLVSSPPEANPIVSYHPENGPLGPSIHHHHHLIQPAIIHENLQIQPSEPSSAVGKDTLEIVDFKPTTQGNSQNQQGYYEYSVNNQHSHQHSYDSNGQSQPQVIEFQPGATANGPRNNDNSVHFEEPFNLRDKLAHVNTMFHQGMKGVFGRNSISQALNQQQPHNLPLDASNGNRNVASGEEDKEGEGSEKGKVVKVPFDNLPQSKEFYMRFLKLWSYYHRNFVCKEKLGTKDNSYQASSRQPTSN